MNEISENSSQESSIQYDLSFLKKPRWILGLLGLFIITIALNFPLGKKIDNLVYSSLSSIPGCPISIDSYELNIFPLPHVSLKNLTIPNRCGGLKNKINLNVINAYIRGPSFSPFGPHFKIETSYKGNPLEFYTTFNLGMDHMLFVVKENNIDLNKFKSFIPTVKLKGKVKTDLLVELKKNKITGLDINLQSKNFKFPSQTINVPTPFGGTFPFLLKELDIQNLLVNATLVDAKKLKINKFILGDEESPIRSEFKGHLDLNQRSMKSSRMTLKGQMALSEVLTNDDSLKIVIDQLKRFDKKENFYQIHVNGQFDQPITSWKIDSKR